MPKHLSAFWAAAEQFMNFPSPLKFTRNPSSPGILHTPPSNPDSLCEATFSQHAPFQPLAPSPWQPRGLVASFTPQCGPRCPSPPGALDMSRQAT